MAVNVPQTVQDIFAEIQKIRGQPVGGPPVRAGAEELAEIMRPAPEEASAGGIAEKFFADWGKGAVQTMEIGSGDNQLGFAGQSVTAPLVVKVTDKQKNQVVDKTLVRFTVSGGGGIIPKDQTTQETTKGEAKLAAVAWKLGAKGNNTVRVTAGNTAVVFSAQAVTSVKATTKTDHPSQAKGTVVPENPTVKVSDHANRGLAGVKVSFAVIGGGSLGGGAVGAPKDVDTDVNGIATAGEWKLGGAAGANSVVASAGPFSETFRCQGT